MKKLCRETGNPVRSFWNSELKLKGEEIQAMLLQYKHLAKRYDVLRDNLVLLGFVFYPEDTADTKKLFGDQVYTGFYKYTNENTDLNLKITLSDWMLYDGQTGDKILAEGLLEGFNIQSAIALLIAWGKNRLPFHLEEKPAGENAK